MFKLLKNFDKKQIKLILLCVLFIIGQVWLDLKLPDYMSNITTLVQTEGSAIGDILKQGGYMLLCALGSLSFAVVVGYLSSNISASFSMRIRKKLFDKVESFSMEQMNKFKVSSLITRTTNDITNVQMFISMGLQLIVKAIITAVWAVLKILDKNIQWSMITGAAVILVLIMVGLLFVLVFPNFKKVQKLLDSVNNVTRENLSGIRVVRAFNAEKYQEDKFEESNDALTRMQTFNQKVFSIMSPFMYLIMYGLTLTIYFVGVYLINDAVMSEKLEIFSNMVVFSSYAMQVIMSFIMLAMIFVMHPRASVSASRICEVLDTDSTITDGTVTKGNNGKVGEIEFKNVSFKYPDGKKEVISNISFSCKKGETVAIIGSTGCGKSTIVNLLMRFYDVTDGEILIDGVNIKDYKLENLHNKMGYVPQKAVMFSDSLKNNVAYGKNGKKKDNKIIDKAIEVAQAKEFATKLPDKYDSHIAFGGTNVSGGQKQRLSIARAIANDPEIYIFDDSFSALDYKTDYKLRKELKKYTKDATNIIVAQRIGTVINADKILVLDNGKCVGYDNHDNLMKTCDVYKEIAYSQLSKEELENARRK